MPSAPKFVATWPILAVLWLAAGCGSQDGPAGENGPAAGGSPQQGGVTGEPAADPGVEPPVAEPESPFPEVVIETSMGNITVKLDGEKAQLTVDNFLRYVDQGHYQNTIFHQVLKDYVILGGSYTPELTEKEADWPIFNQAQGGLKNLRATIAMARKPDEIDSATCQFFINLKDNPQLDHQGAAPDQYGYCVFGKVIEGMEIVDQIAGVAVHDTPDFEQIPVQTVLIKSIRRAP